MPLKRSAADQQLDYAALAEFRYQLRVFLRYSEDIARSAGLEPQQHQLLLAIKGAPEDGLSIRYLSERLQLKHNSTVGLIDRLQGRGLVRRRRDTRDRRLVHVELTPKGEATLRQLSEQNLIVLKSTEGLLHSLQKLTREARLKNAKRLP
jgi:DNA-binding MarR family transcriptional regulator